MCAVRQRLWRLIGSGLVVVLAARLCYLVVRYQGPDGPVKRPHIESAALLLAVVGLIVRFAAGRNAPASTGHQPSLYPGTALWLSLIAGSLALYWPALHIGLLSDDFILVQHARAWDVSQVAPQLFRPLPLLVWAVILRVGGDAAMLHLVNILLHATNAYLASRVVAGWVNGRWWAAMSALLFMAAPLGAEAVAWCAGTFDLFATMWMLCAVLIARTAGAGLRDRALLVAFTIAALLSKETSVVLPLVLLIDALVTRPRLRSAVISIGMVAALALAFGAIRIQSATPVETTVSRYRVQRLLFDSFGALAAPWHVADPGLTAIRTGYALCVIALIASFFMNPGARWASRAGAGGTGWVLASILPLLAFFYVGPQLEGARYLYLAACGWSAILVTAAADLAGRGPRAAIVVRALVVVLIGVGAWGVRQHLHPWTRAAATRDSVLGVAAGDQRLRGCPVAYIEGLPDAVDGAYLFANGAREALAGVGVSAFARAGSGDCAFRWDAGRSAFLPVSVPAR